ncbi:peptide chain release factor N(5)-glutamine methyltransferase [Magnetospira thiophila]
MTLGTALAEATARLASAGIDNPRLEARLLLAWALDLTPEIVFGYPERPLDPAGRDRLRDALDRRVARQPLAQIIGQREFWSLPFRVNEQTLIPRPDSETLIETVLDLPLSPRARLLDLGTGSGCLLLALLHELPEATGLGVDLSFGAVAVARDNAEALGLQDRADFVVGDWWAPVRGRFDVVISNPPYIRRDDLAGLAPEVRQYEPRQALDGGPDGLDFYRRLAAEVPRYLVDGGWLAVEVGQGQADDVTALFRRAGLHGLSMRQDLSAIPRCVFGQRKST